MAASRTWRFQVPPGSSRAGPLPSSAIGCLGQVSWLVQLADSATRITGPLGDFFRIDRCSGPFQSHLPLPSRSASVTPFVDAVTPHYAGPRRKKHHEIEWFFPTTVDSWSDTTIVVDLKIRAVVCSRRLILLAGTDLTGVTPSLTESPGRMTLGPESQS
jgi:hypothetical protein